MIFLFAASRGFSLVAVHGFLIVVASLMLRIVLRHVVKRHRDAPLAIHLDRIPADALHVRLDLLVGDGPQLRGRQRLGHRRIGARRIPRQQQSLADC